MQFLAILRRRTEAFTEAQFAEVLGPEAEHARGLYARDAFRAIFSRGDVPGAVIFVEAPDVAEAMQLVGGLPLVLTGMAEVSLIPLLAYRGFVGG